MKVSVEKSFLGTIFALLVNSPAVEGICEGNRPHCFTLGGIDPVECAKHEKCYMWKGSCLGKPRQCDEFPTASLCWQMRGRRWTRDNGGDGVNRLGGEHLGTYKGNANVTLDYFNYNVYTRQFEVVERKQFQYPAQIQLSTPRTDTVETERNAFSLVIDPDQAMAQEGQISIQSSTVVTTPYTGRSLLLQFWSYDLDGNKIEGILDNAHRAEAADSHNMIWVNIRKILADTMNRSQQIGCWKEQR